MQDVQGVRVGRGRALPPRTMLAVVGGCFAVVAVILLVVCAGLVVADNNFRAKAVPADGTVISYATKRDGDRHRTTYAPVVRFSTPDGRTFEFTSGIYKSGKPATGQVRVLYDPDDPQHAKVDDNAGRLLGPVITGGLGGLFLVLGGLMVVLRRRIPSPV